jgi:hypothetical protein
MDLSEDIDFPTILTRLSAAAAARGVPEARRSPQRLWAAPTAGVPVLGESVLRGWALLLERAWE